MTSGSSTSPTAAAHRRQSSTQSSSHRHHPVRSPANRHSSISKSQSPSPERTRKRPTSSRVVNGHANSKATNGHGDSEAETDILSDEEQIKSKAKKRVVKHEPKDDTDASSVSLKTKSEPTRSHTISRASSVNGDVADKKERKLNGADRRENGQSKALLKDKPRFSSEFNKNSSRAQSADATTSLTEQSDRSRQAHSAEPRKRKFSDVQRPSTKLEPPRQKPRLDEAVGSAKPQKRQPSSPPTPGTPGLRSSHRRSASTQSNLPSAGLSSTRVRRDISSSSLPPIGKEWATSDMSSDEAASYPSIPKLAPPPRSGRAAYRAMTSPTRNAPTGKRADRFGSTPLAKACEKGNFPAVKTAYEEAPGEIDQPDNGGFAPLQKAALEGHADIVQFLLEKGCRKDCCSKDEQDTPLIDAVENGHVDVVKLLLDHGVNPHHQNKSGKRAIDAIDEDEDCASDIREMLTKAMQDYVGSESDSDDDNQDFPLIRPEDKNRTDLLYLEPNRKNLLDYSRKGDVVAVDHFLSSVKPDNSHAVVAARAGHHLVLNLLLASAGNQLEKDPDPARYDETPLLAAIGRGHLKVVKLLIQQDNFNPSRKTKEGKLYWEVAEERRGPRWQTERDLLKEYYDAYTSKRKVQKRKRVQEIDKPDRRKSNAKEPPSSPQVPKEKKVPRKPPVLSPSTKEAKRKYRPVLDSSDSEGSDEEVRVRKKPMRERRVSMVSRSSNNEPLSPVMSRKLSGSKTIKREDSRASKDSSKPSSRKPSSDKRHSTDSKIDDKPDKPPVKASTPESVREARKAEEDARAAKAAEKAAEAEKRKREAQEAAAQEAAAKEAARKAEEERLREEKEEKERKEKEERERKEQAEREERERRVAALPTALRVAVQKGDARPLHFRPATKDHPEELGISMQFLPIQTSPLRNIDPACDDSTRDELWMMNFQIVGILGLPSELRMAEFPDWEKKEVTDEQRQLFLDNYDLSKLAQDYRWPQAGEAGYNYGHITQALKDTREAFLKMEPLQWVRYSDFEKALTRPEYKHLDGVRLRTSNCRIKEEPDSAIDISFLFDDDEPPVVPSKEELDKKVDSVAGSAIAEEKKTEKVS